MLLPAPLYYFPLPAEAGQAYGGAQKEGHWQPRREAGGALPHVCAL